VANTLALSSSGSDIFFTTRTPLVGQDADVLRDVYDAAANRCVDGESRLASFPETEAEASACKNAGGKLELAGLPRPQAAPSCSDDACQGPSSPPEAFTPAASSLFTAGQNLTAPLISVAPSREVAPKLTLAQQLAKALKACKRKPKRKRAACEAQARKRYGGKGTPKKTAKARKNERRRR
jgi:hypothetical protein